MRLPAIILSASVFAISASAVAIEDRVLELPADYRVAYDNYYAANRQIQEDQFISLYANDVARVGAAKDGTLPDGSVIIGEIYGVKKDADGEVMESMLGHRIPETLKAIVMMERKASWADQYAEGNKVGGWEFEVFSPAGENLGKDTTACRECHEPLGATEYTWSIEHLGAAN